MRRTLRILMILISGSASFSALFGQENYPAELVELRTDRSVYISGENILFTGQLKSTEVNNVLSEVVYVELITPHGQKINQAKINLKENRFEGRLNIHQENLSGYYFLRAYTKWMRNGQPEDYAYVLLKLINPLTAELLEINKSLVVDSLLSLEIKTDNRLGINLDKDTYSPGDKLIVSLNTDQLKNACLSIIPSVSMPIMETNIKRTSVEYTKVSYYPETRGISASGKVISKQTGNPLPFHNVSIHLKDEMDFISVLSDTAGSFYTALPERYGSRELFFIAASLENDEVELLIDQDFCSKRTNLSVPSFSIDPREDSQLLQMVQNQQLSQAYQNMDSVVNLLRRQSPFYGEALRTIDFDDYIVLDSLELYFTDLLSSVIIKKKKGKRVFSLSGAEPELKMYDPLVLVDWVPVDDADLILALDPNRIKKFEVINKAYLHGGIIYGGIISIISSNGDFAGLEFPESGMYLNYGFFSNSESFRNKITEQDYPFRNTYGWVPNLESIQQPLEFSVPQTKGDYLLVLQTKDEKGEDLILSLKFKVE